MQTEYKDGICTESEFPDELYPLIVFQEELKHPSTARKLSAMARVSQVAIALGPDLSREELLPLLLDRIDLEDEVLLVLAEELVALVDLSGGIKYGFYFLQILELLACKEEPLVRENAIAAIIAIMEKTASAVLAAQDEMDAEVQKHSLVSMQDNIEELFDIVERLGKSDWFAARTSACFLFPALYSLYAIPGVVVIPEDPNNTGKCEYLRALYFSLCNKEAESSMVRRASAAKLASFKIHHKQYLGFAEVLEPAYLKNETYQTILGFFKDTEDSVRIVALESAVTILPLFYTQTSNTLWVDLKGMAEDRSWKVRYMFVSLIVQMTEKLRMLRPEEPRLSTFNTVMRKRADFPSPTILHELLMLMTKLLKDSLSEVKSVALCKLPDFLEAVCDGVSENIEKTFLEHFEPILSTVITDTNQHVRSALASCLAPIAKHTSPESLQKYISPYLNNLLKDTFPEVKLNLLSGLGELSAKFDRAGLEALLLPLVSDLSQDGQWRIRLALLEVLSTFIETLGQDAFVEGLLPLYLKAAQDSVSAIRQAVPKEIGALVKRFGDDWAFTSLLPQLALIAQSEKYMYRTTTLNCILALATNAQNKDKTYSLAMPLIDTLSKDAIANVRLNVAKGLGTLMSENALSLAGRDAALSLLHTLRQDSDSDVVYFATKAGPANQACP